MSRTVLICDDAIFMRTLVGDILQQAGFDVVGEADDLGGQDRTLFSPRTYRELVKPLHRELFAYLHAHTDAKVFFHTCGAVRDLIPDLILSEGGQPETRLLEEQIGDSTFADLKLPCVLTAVDLKSGKEVLLSQGRLVDAMLATIAMPGVFPARYIDGLELVDGGTLDPVPVVPARPENGRDSGNEN